MIILNMDTQSAKLNVSVQNAKLDMKNAVPNPKIELSTQPTKLDIQQSSVQLSIDQYPCRASYGLKNTIDATRENAEKGRQMAWAASGDIAEKGNRLANISSRENAIANMAAESTVDPQGDLQLVRTDPPQVEAHITPAKINVSPGNTTIKFQTEEVTGDYQPGKVNGQMLRYPSIRFWLTENKVDMSM